MNSNESKLLGLEALTAIGIELAEKETTENGLDDVGDGSASGLDTRPLCVCLCLIGTDVGGDAIIELGDKETAPKLELDGERSISENDEPSKTDLSTEAGTKDAGSNATSERGL